MAEEGGNIPSLSVVLATDTYETIRPVIAALRRQRAPRSIEIVLAMPAGAARSIGMEEVEPFAAVRVVAAEVASGLATARAAAVHVSTAPVVFIGETHSYPQPGWAEALLAPFADGWTAVVPAIDNANPTGPVSWAAYVFDYATWSSNREPGEMRDPLIYNTAYRRDALLALDDLDRALDPGEEAMWTQLRAGGCRAFFAPDARILHLNVGRATSFFDERFSAGGVLGLRRAARWPMSRRLMYVLASPLIPVVLLARLVPAAWRLGLAKLPAATLPLIVGAAIVKTAGELFGYLGLKLLSVEARLADIEIHKLRYAGRRG